MSPLSFFLRLTLFALMQLGCETNGLASLSWDVVRQTFHPGADEKTISAHFHFANSGPDAVTITDVKTSCGCTTARSPKMTYAPGEKGAIDVMYDIGDQTGLQVRTIAVSTDEPQHPVYTLSLTAYLPEPLKITPRYVYWEAASNASPQKISLTAPPSHPVRVLSVISNNPAIKAALAVEHDGAAYSISVSPADTKSQIRSMLTIETDLQLNGKNRKFFAYADVRPPTVPKPSINN